MGASVQDWDVEQDRRTAPVGSVPVHPAAVLASVVLFALVAVTLGTAMRAARHERSFSAPTVTASAPPEPAGESAPDGPGQDAAAVERAADILLGRGDLYAIGPDSMNLSPGQTVVLRNLDTEVRVKPGRVTVGTDTCAAGSLLKVELSVDLVRGSADLPVHDFALLGPDGSVVRALEACSVGFSEPAPQRTVAFSAVQPGRLVYGSDQADPVAVWQLI
jgi:hypothetical protein